MVAKQPTPPRMIIVLDTEPFDAALYQVETGRLKELREEASKRKALIAITDVQLHEIKAHVARDVEQTKKVVNGLLAHAGKHSIRKSGSDETDLGIPLPRLLKHGAIRRAFDAVSMAAEEAQRACDAFLSQITTIDCGEVTASRLLPNYFQGNAPFSPGRKKDEFPDAIAIEALKDFVAANKGSQIVVISGDPDWQRALESHDAVKMYPSAAEALQDLRALDEVAEMIKNTQCADGSRLRELIEEDFPELAFSLDEEWGADVENVETDSAKVTTLDVTSLQNHVATIEFEAVVCFRCTAQSVDDEYTHWQPSYQIAHIEARTSVAGSANVRLFDDDSDVEDIEDLSLEDPIRVSLDDASRIETKRPYAD